MDAISGLLWMVIIPTRAYYLDKLTRNHSHACELGGENPIKAGERVIGEAEAELWSLTPERALGVDSNAFEL